MTEPVHKVRRARRRPKASTSPVEMAARRPVPLTIAEAAERIGETPGLIRRAIAGGALEAREERGMTVVSDEELTAWWDEAKRRMYARREKIIKKFADHQRNLMHRLRFVSAKDIIDHYANKIDADRVRAELRVGLRDREFERGRSPLLLLHPVRPRVRISGDEMRAVLSVPGVTIDNLWLPVAAFNAWAKDRGYQVPAKWAPTIPQATPSPAADPPTSNDEPRHPWPTTQPRERSQGLAWIEVRKIWRDGPPLALTIDKIIERVGPSKVAPSTLRRVIEHGKK